ncbi:HAD family hydrolase [Catenulispora subtropica]|uniref:HAD family hydrolase n=1 Tax=Catenulispora subtropica TaxID=450798 RepID=A0ABP5C4E7_9ACTN
MAEQTFPPCKPLLVVDFDGTVYRDDAPVRFYAEHAAATLPAAARARMLDRFEAYLAEGVAAAAGAADETEAAVLSSSVDAWGAAAGLGALHGVDGAALETAFLASRKFMLTAECAVTAIPALVEAFEELRGPVRIVLATNSPAEGLAPLLDRLGVTGLFDEVRPGSNKPDGLRRWISWQVAARPPGELFSLGDHYFNEIEPAMAVGARAGYIDRFGRADGPATVTAEAVEDVLPGIFAWVRTVGS